jgi:hypothetical protein
MNHESVSFRDVRVGDKVYDSHYFASDKWREVTKTTISPSGVVSLYLGVTAHPTIDTRTQIVGHHYEGIAVKREGD